MIVYLYVSKILLVDTYEYTPPNRSLRNPQKRPFSSVPAGERPGEHRERYLTPATSITTTGNVTAPSSVPSATAPDTGFTSR
jgi:hypothetical protein